MKVVDLNCDLGESYGNWRLGDDESIMPLVTTANVACGFHGGDPLVMARTAALAREHGIAAGSHPGYPDLLGFGRRAYDLTPAEAAAYMIEHALPEHPLRARRFLSIGCVPCTRAVAEGEDERAGRWSGSGKTECGLHTHLAPAAR